MSAIAAGRSTERSPAMGVCALAIHRLPAEPPVEPDVPAPPPEPADKPPYVH